MAAVQKNAATAARCPDCGHKAHPETPIECECPFRETCTRLGGICQCAEEQQADDEDRRRSELGDDW